MASRYSPNNNFDIDGLKEYYIGPVREGQFVLSLFNSKIDADNTSDTDLGSALLGGLLVSNDMATYNDFVGVVIVYTTDKAIAVSVQKTRFMQYLNGYISMDALLADVTSVSFDLEEIPQFQMVSH
jgi:hypothetical protein